MQIKTFQSNLSKQGISITVEALTEYLKELGLDEVPQSMVNELTADLKTKYASALELVEQGKGYLKGVETPAQPPAQASQQPAVNVQPVGSAIHGTVKELVVTHSQGEKEAIAALANYYSGTSSRIADGVNQHLSLIDFNSPLESLVQQQRDGWASTHAAIAEAIANVNQAAGLNNAA